MNLRLNHDRTFTLGIKIKTQLMLAKAVFDCQWKLAN